MSEVNQEYASTQNDVQKPENTADIAVNPQLSNEPQGEVPGPSPVDTMDLGSMEIEFGVPGSYSARTPKKKEEKYPDTPVLTMHAAPTEAKKAFRFELNTKGQELLGLKGNDVAKGASEHIAFSFKVKGHLLLINISDTPDAAKQKGSIRFGKTGTFADKTSHEFLSKQLSLDVTGDNEFELVHIAHNQYKMADLKLRNAKEGVDTGLNVEPQTNTNY